VQDKLAKRQTIKGKKRNTSFRTGSPSDEVKTRSGGLAAVSAERHT
jgi:hypothetical protein